MTQPTGSAPARHFSSQTGDACPAVALVKTSAAAVLQAASDLEEFLVPVSVLRNRPVTQLLVPQPSGLSAGEFATQPPACRPVNAAVEEGTVGKLPGKDSTRELAKMLLRARADAKTEPSDEQIDAAATQIAQGEWDALKPKDVSFPEHVFLTAMQSIDPRASQAQDSKHGLASSSSADGKHATTPRIVAFAADMTVPSSDRFTLARRELPEYQASVAMGSTFPAKAGTPARFQDAACVSEFATVVVDGLGGHDRNQGPPVRVAGLSTANIIAAIIDTVGRTQARPAHYLKMHGMRLIELADRAVYSAVASHGNGLEARASFSAIADYPDGILPFACGDATVKIVRKNLLGITRVTSLTPQQGVEMDQVGGLGDCKADASNTLFGEIIPRKGVEMLYSGTDGMFVNVAGVAALDVSALDKSSARKANEQAIGWLDRQTHPLRSKPGAGAGQVQGLDDFAVVARKPRDYSKGSSAG